MKIIKFLGKLLSLPFSIILVVVLLSIFPLRLINNWLNGYGKYNKTYLTFARESIKKAWHAAFRKEHPVLKNFLVYVDEQEVMVLKNDRTDPFVHKSKREEVITIIDQNGHE